MFLAGYETRPNERAFGGYDYRVFVLSPLRTGRITYWIDPCGSYGDPGVLGHWKWAQGKIKRYGTEYIKSRYDTFILEVNSSDETDWSNKHSGIASHIIMGIFPLEWEGVTRTPPIMASLMTPLKILQERPTAGLLLVYPEIKPPSLEFVASCTLPSKLTCKPGKSISALATIRAEKVGGSFHVTLTNRLMGKTAEKTIALNPEESEKLEISETMPALLPNEKVDISFRIKNAICNLDKMVRMDENRETIARQLAKLLHSKTFISTITPTDCLLADTKCGLIQILGDNLKYSGWVISEKKVGPLSGKAPALLDLGDITYIRLDFNREIAICEDRNLLDDNAKTYEYSALPTPFMLFQRVKFFADSFRPATPFEAPLPVPKFTIGPRIRVR